MSWWPQSKLQSLRGPDRTALSHNTNFSRLWGAQVLSQIAQNLLNFALIIRVFELAQGTRLANVSVALVILSFGIPSIFFAAAAGVYVDHWNRKHVLVVANILRAVLVLGYLVFEHNLLLVLLLSFTISSITQFFAPAEAASIPVLVGEKNLLRANSLFIFTLYASFIIGYASAAPVIALFGSSGPYILTSLMFVVATLLVSALPTIRAKSARHVTFRSVARSTGREIVRNWSIIRNDHRLSFPIAQLTISQATVGVVLALAPALSLAVLRAPIQEASHELIIPAGLGMVLGVIVIGRLVGRFAKAKIVAASLVAASATLTLLGLSGLLHRMNDGREIASAFEIGVVVTLLVLVLGFMNAIIAATSQTILQENTTDETRGKVFGALGMMVNIAATAPILLAGVLADLTSVTRVITVVGALLFLYSIGQYGYMATRGRLA